MVITHASGIGFLVRGHHMETCGEEIRILVSNLITGRAIHQYWVNDVITLHQSHQIL
ncbi:Uncharacterised protein [Vibrio cholerae]|nr:Uncharacterised protein [Vibrio cholerae]